MNKRINAALTGAVVGIAGVSRGGSPNPDPRRVLWRW